MAEKKYYWLKLKKDFFKRHDIQIIEAMPNGKDYVLFYLKLLCESVDHNGNLRFSETIPYNEDMLATITHTNVDVVRTAIQAFHELGLLEIMDDGTYYMNEVDKMIGTYSQDDQTRESTRLRVQACRERKKQAQIDEKRYSNVTCNGEIDIDKDIDKEKDKEVKHTYGEYKHVKLTDKQLDKLISDFGKPTTDAAIKLLDEYIQEKGYKSKDHNLAIRRWVINAVKERQAKPKAKQAAFYNIDMKHDYDYDTMERELLGL